MCTKARLLAQLSWYILANAKGKKEKPDLESRHLHV